MHTGELSRLSRVIPGHSLVSMGSHPEPHATGPVEESESSSDDDAARLVAAGGVVVSFDQLLEAAKTNFIRTHYRSSESPMGNAVAWASVADTSTSLQGKAAVSWKDRLELDGAEQTLDSVQLKVSSLCCA